MFEVADENLQGGARRDGGSGHVFACGASADRVIYRAGCRLGGRGARDRAGVLVYAVHQRKKHKNAGGLQRGTDVQPSTNGDKE